MKLTPGRWAIFVTLVATLAVAATWPVFSQTFDEPAHLATGMEWLDRGTYTLEPLHPPLTRVAAALPPYLDGLRSAGGTWVFSEGNRILQQRDTYRRNLVLARLGVLPFLPLLALGVWLWAGWLVGPPGAAVAVGLTLSLPPVLAHAGLATTDLGFTACFVLALYALARWWDEPTMTRGLGLGATAGLAVAAKFSAGLFLPAAAVAMIGARVLARTQGGVLAGRSPRRTLASLGAAVLVGALVVAAVYRFQVGAFFAGLRMVREHQAAGHDAFLLGEVSNGGWWYFFPVALAVKTPLAFLALASAGWAWAVRRTWREREDRFAAPALAALAIVLVTMFSRVTIGLRHVLPVYPLLAITAGGLVARQWNTPERRRLVRGLVVVVAAAQLAAPLRAHPDHLAWFNVLAGRQPERVLVAGDLDWGQDLFRLADAVRGLGVDSLAMAYFGSADPRRLLPVPVRPLAPDERAAGWIAVSEAVLKGVGFEPHRGFEWLEPLEPAARVGRSIRLYHRPTPPP